MKEGIYKANQKIPTELELSEKYQISRMTVRKALAELVEEGVLAKNREKEHLCRKKR
ncbi:MAG: GntR family transcriptional regulator [Blautia faecis]